MNGTKHYYKLGLFTLLGAFGIIGMVFLFGVMSVKKTVRYYTFFDESVQGLEPGAPVKFRGVPIGHVSKISIAPDRQHVGAIIELDRAAAKDMAALPPGLRAQLATQGITGVKFMSLELFDPKTHPPPELPFTPPEPYIPSTPSTLKSLEEMAANIGGSLPDVIQNMQRTMGRVDRVLETLERNDVASEAVTTLRRANEALGAVQATVAHVDRAHLGDKTSGTLAKLDESATKLNGALDRLEGDDGLLAAATQATRSFDAIGQNGRKTQRDLEGTLRDMSDAADALRSLARSVERDPEMLLKGKTEGKGFK